MTGNRAHEAFSLMSLKYPALASLMTPATDAADAGSTNTPEEAAN